MCTFLDPHKKQKVLEVQVKVMIDSRVSMYKYAVMFVLPGWM